MEVKGINNSVVARPAYSKQAVQKNQVAFQGLKQVVKNEAIKLGVAQSPLGMITDPMHFALTLLNKGTAEAITAAINIGKAIVGKK